MKTKITLILAALLAMPILESRAAVVLTTLHAFRVFTNGANPKAGLVQGSDGYFYGTTFDGGTNGGAGTVFKISPAGVLTTLYSFTGGADGSAPNGLVQGADGNLYGTTYGKTQSGLFPQPSDCGTVFRISTNGALTHLYTFTDDGGSDGHNPQATLVQGADGYFYGTTFFGGANFNGTVFKVSVNGTLTTLHSFTGGADGAQPDALVLSSEGGIYGTTRGGGFTNQNVYGYGTLFKITANGGLTTVHSFTGGDGASPDGLVRSADGNFYGTTQSGGTNDDGTVFKITTSGALVTVYSFIDDSDGRNPYGLVQGDDGFLYGTADGPSNATNGGYGTVFKISTNGTFATLYSFTGGNLNANPNALVQGTDGDFYGTTGSYDTFGTFIGTNGPPTVGGTAVSVGAVFKISTNGAFTTLYSFPGVPGVNDGANPQAALVQGGDGNFYGATRTFNPMWGFSESTLFKISTNGTLTALYAFGSLTNASGERIDGAGPSGLCQGTDGFLYGTTASGGTNGGYGTVFKISINGELTTLYSFTGGDDGGGSWAGLVQGSDGYFYGTTSAGGTNDRGTVFKMGADGALTTLHSFTGVYDGENPLASLIEGSDGFFYGTTDDTVFRISTNGLLATLVSFHGGNYGVYPVGGGLVQGSDGDFYGTTQTGVTFDSGTVFQITAAGVFNTLYTFDGHDGTFPEAGLVQGSDGDLYGTTVSGGAFSDENGYDGYGTVFKITTNGVLTTLYSFSGGNDGAGPEAGLVAGGDGHFYGTTCAGGEGGLGTVFRLTILPEFQALTLTNNLLSLRWSTEPGASYQLQYTSDLSSSNWINLNTAVTAAGTALNTTDSITNGPQRFYRLMLPR